MDYLYQHLLSLYSLWQMKKNEHHNFSHFFYLAQTEQAKDNELYDHDRAFISEQSSKKVIKNADIEWLKVENAIDSMSQNEWLKFTKELVYHPKLAEFLLYSHEKAFNVIHQKGFDFNQCIVKKKLTLNYMEHYQIHGEKEFVDKTYLMNVLENSNLSVEIKKEIEKDIQYIDDFFVENILCYINLQKNHPYLNDALKEMKSNIYRYAQDSSTITKEFHVGLLDYVRAQIIELNHGNEEVLNENTVQEYLRNNRNGIITLFLNQGMKIYLKYLEKIVHSNNNTRYNFKDEAFIYANLNVLNDFLEVAITFLLPEITQKLVSLGANILQIYELDNVQKSLKDKEYHIKTNKQLKESKAIIDSIYEKAKLDSIIIPMNKPNQKIKI